MSPGLFSDLDAIRAFLADEIAGHVPAHLRSELRGAIKVLGEIAGEIDALPALLHAEGHEMVALAARADATLETCLPGFAARTRTGFLSGEFDRPMGSLRGLMKLHEEALADAELILAEIQTQLARADIEADLHARLQELAESYLALLGAQADARMQWQSVFSPPGRP